MTRALAGIRAILTLTLLLPAAACTRRGASSAHDQPPAPTSVAALAHAPLAFTDLRRQTAEFIEYNKTIRLTPEQEKVKAEALDSIPAPCCGEFSAATCCCACNFSKSLWGLTHYLIAREGRNTGEVKSAALHWIAFTHPKGSSGKACFNGGCNRSFSDDGCGGMQESDLRL